MTTMTETERPEGLHPMWSSFQERAAAIAAEAERLTGPDRLDENFLEKAGRLNEAQREAERIILDAEQAFSATTEKGTDD